MSARDLNALAARVDAPAPPADLDSGAWSCATTAAAFAELRPEWEALFAANPLHSPFLAWGWVDAWLRHLAGPHELRIVLWRDRQGGLQFILPLIVRPRQGPLWTDVVTLVCGYGPDCSDYLGGLRLPRHDSRVADLLGDAISRFGGTANVVRLPFLSGQDALVSRLALMGRSQGRRARVSETERCPRVALPADFDAFMKSLSGNFRSQVRRHFNRIGKQPDLEFRAFGHHEAHDFVRSLIELNRSRMKEKGDVSSLEDADFRAFLGDAIPYMAERGIAWLDAVEQEGSIIGASLNFVHGNSVYYYMGGFDAEASKFRPGIALFAHVIQRSIARGCGVYDFLRGVEAYKYRWGAVDVPLESVDLYPATAFGGRAAWIVESAKRCARQLVNAARHRSHA